MIPLIPVTVLLPEPFSPPKTWSLRLPAATASRLAEHVFHLSNCPPGALSPADQDILEQFPRTGLRSVSVGDIIIIQDTNNPAARHILSVAPVGFTAH